MCSRISWCFGRSFFTNNFERAIQNYSDDKKNYLHFRYLRIVRNLEMSTKRSAFWYYTLTSMVTIGSIMTPALISVQGRPTEYDSSEEEAEKHANNVYWSVWGISILVTCSNAIIKLLDLDKTYITRNIRVNQLRSEGCMYLSKSGIYKIQDDDARFKEFVNNVEKIKNHQIVEEYTQHQNMTRAGETDDWELELATTSNL